MSQFCMQHPWAVFWVVIFFLAVVDNMWCNWCNRNKPPTSDCNCED